MIKLFELDATMLAFQEADKALKGVIQVDTLWSLTSQLTSPLSASEPDETINGDSKGDDDDEEEEEEECLSEDETFELWKRCEATFRQSTGDLLSDYMDPLVELHMTLEPAEFPKSFENDPPKILRTPSRKALLPESRVLRSLENVSPKIATKSSFSSRGHLSHRIPDGRGCSSHSANRSLFLHRFARY